MGEEFDLVLHTFRQNFVPLCLILEQITPKVNLQKLRLGCPYTGRSPVPLRDNGFRSRFPVSGRRFPALGP
jgi:hypothetical protein